MRRARAALRRAASGRRAAASSVLERAEHERQRRAELVAHVGEERGLGAVELGEGLGAAALVLVGARVGEAVADLAGGELEEAAVGVVEAFRGLTPATRKPEGCGWPGETGEHERSADVRHAPPGSSRPVADLLDATRPEAARPSGPGSPATRSTSGADGRAGWIPIEAARSARERSSA